MIKHETEKKFKCNICEYACRTSSSLKMHMLCHENDEIKCRICSSIFTSKAQVIIHLKEIHTAEESQKCIKCGKVLTSRIKLSWHQTTHNRKASDIIECKICHKKLLKRAIKLHNLIHSGKRLFKCNFSNCHHAAKTETALKAHKQTHRKQFRCKICKKRFSHNFNLRMHHENHHENKRFSCDICNAKLFSERSLKYHLAGHEEKVAKPFSCDHCPMQFRKKAFIIPHFEAVHIKLKPFSCDLCSRKFVNLSYLRPHMKFHLVDKEFKCELCSAQFSRKQQFNEHILQHSDPKPWKCDLCPSQVTAKNVLQSHMRFVHKRKWNSVI